MKGITFGSLHSYNDFGLILNSKEIGSPEVKKSTVEIEGADGVLDYTDYFGEPKFNNRELSFEFSVLSDYNDVFSDFCDAVNGQKMNIEIDDDPGFYYVGRVSCSSLKVDKKIGKFTAKCDCEPYKLKNAETTVSRSVSGSASITLTNSRKRVVPTITTSAQMTIAFGTYSQTVSAGTFTIPELELQAGSTTVTVTGTGTITFKYREGRI